MRTRYLIIPVLVLAGCSQNRINEPPILPTSNRLVWLHTVAAPDSRHHRSILRHEIDVSQRVPRDPGVRHEDPPVVIVAAIQFESRVADLPENTYGLVHLLRRGHGRDEVAGQRVDPGPEAAVRRLARPVQVRVLHPDPALDGDIPCRPARRVLSAIHTNAMSWLRLRGQGQSRAGVRRLSSIPSGSWPPPL